MKNAKWGYVLVVLALAFGLASWKLAGTADAQGQKAKPAPAAKAKASPRVDPCAQTPLPDPITKAIPVKIMPDSTGSGLEVKPNTVCVDKKNDEQVKWEWAGPPGTSPNYEIFFADKEYPFSKRHFSKASPQSGKAKVNANIAKKYKYIVAADSYNPIDPDVIIK